LTQAKAAIQAHSETIATLNDQLSGTKQALDLAARDLKAAKDSLALAPFMDATGGRDKPISDGSANADAENLWAVYNGLKTPREKAEFWQAHEAELKKTARR
jgi:hypothetical protein